MNTLDDAHFGQDVYPEPERTSVAAILGFILSLGGCLFGLTAVLGVPLSIFGIVASAKSRGRVGGKGLGIAGLLVGLLMLALWGGCLGISFFGIKTGLTQFGRPAAATLTSVQSDDFDAARANLVSPGTDVSDQELVAFREAYRASLGDFVSVPSGAIEYLTSFGAVGPIMQSASGQQNVFPVPAQFDSGPALIIVGFNQQAQVNTLTIIDLNGDEYTLPMPPGWDSQDSATDPADTDDTDPESNDEP